MAAGGFSGWVLKKGYERYLQYNIKYSSESLYYIALAVAASGDDNPYIMVDENYLMILRCQSSNDLGRVIFLWMVVLVDYFLLSNAVEVGEIFMKYGLLHIDLNRALPKPVI